MMRAIRIILTWIALLLVIQLLVVWMSWHPHNKGPWVHRGYGNGEVVDVLIFEDGDGYIVQEHVIVNLEQRSLIGSYRFIVREEHMPVEFFYEFLTKSMLTVSIGDAVVVPGYSDPLVLSPAQSAKLESALYDFAREHKELSRANPGGRPTVRFDWDRAGFSLLMLIPFGSMSAFMTFGVESEIKKLKDKRATHRRCRGRCMHCGYQVAGIEGDVCPECGKEHGSGVEVVA